MRVRYTPRSRRDLEAIYAYIDEQSPGAARSVKRAYNTPSKSSSSFHASGL